LPLLDGLDELEPTRQGKCLQAINQFLQGYRLKHLVVCCRLAEYQNCNFLKEPTGVSADFRVRSLDKGAFMEPILFRYRGRDLCAVDIALVRATIAAHYAEGRSFIAQVLCHHWGWCQPNGANKGFAARDLLLRLEEAGHVTCRHERPSRTTGPSHGSIGSRATLEVP
jgi:hypothetical protein